METPQNTINSYEFYGHYFGHTTEHLSILHDYFRSLGKHIIWLMGDSSLDNKNWVPEPKLPAVNGYENVLRPAFSRQDVCYHLNVKLVGTQYVCINAAREEARICNFWNIGPSFIDKEHDIVILSIGGNDVILRPSIWTIATLAIGNYLIPECFIQYLMWIPNPLKTIFYTQTRALVESIPCNKVHLCTVYYPCEVSEWSWASKTLDAINISKMQRAIRVCFTEYHSKIAPSIPLYEALDPKDPADYVQRVEPSIGGGAKLAALIYERVFVDK